MASGGWSFKRVLFSVYLVIVHLALIYFAGETLLERKTLFTRVDETRVADPTLETPVPTPLPVPTDLSDLSNTNAAVLPLPNISLPAIPEGELMIPVAGVSPDQLQDTYTQTRANGRTHEAIDIMAPAGTPVIAAADGRIVKFWDSEAGGITIYQLSSDGKYFYYYAHLQRRAPEIKEGDVVRRGATIGFVGDTGNAGAGNNHLHFGVSIVRDPKRYWDGISVNPYPLLVRPSP